MRKLAIATTLAAAALIVPVAAVADHGQNGQGQNQPQSNTHKCSKLRNVAFVLHGTFASFSAGTVTMNVTGGNHAARKFLGTATTYSYAGTGPRTKFVGLTDTNADGTIGYDDATSADRINIIGKLAEAKHGCPTVTPTVTIRKVTVKAPHSQH